MKVKYLVLGIFIVLFFETGKCRAEKDWHVTECVNQATPSTLRESFYSPSDLVNSYVVGSGGSKELYRHKGLFGLEREGIVVPDWGVDGENGFQQSAGSHTFKWFKLPWSQYLSAKIGMGDGLSYTSKLPAHEEDRHDEKRTGLLDYLILELAVPLPNKPNIQMFFRIHHRPEITGLFKSDEGIGIHGGSSIPCLGVKYFFKQNPRN